MKVVASLSQGRTAAAQCGLFTYRSVPVIFEPSCIYIYIYRYIYICMNKFVNKCENLKYPVFIATVRTSGEACLQLRALLTSVQARAECRLSKFVRFTRRKWPVVSLG